MEEEKFEITKKILEKTLNYLATQPYIQVAQLIQELQKSASLLKPKNEIEKDKTK